MTWIEWVNSSYNPGNFATLEGFVGYYIFPVNVVFTGGSKPVPICLGEDEVVPSKSITANGIYTYVPAPEIEIFELDKE